MGCPELSIESYFRIIRPDGKPLSRPDGTCTQKTAYSRFSQPVVSNYRYYSPQLGRWLGRDPIHEWGGWNLYGTNQNDSINKWDYLGEIAPYLAIVLIKMFAEGAISSVAAAITTAVLQRERNWPDIGKSAIVAFPGGFIGGIPTELAPGGGAVSGAVGNALSASIAGNISGSSPSETTQNVVISGTIGGILGNTSMGDAISGGIITGLILKGKDLTQELLDKIQELVDKISKEREDKLEECGCGAK